MQHILTTQHFMLENKATADNFTNARSALYNLGIKTSYDNNRMIFSTLHTQKNQLSSTYAQECNGLILSMDDWHPLMVPPRSLKFNINNDVSNTFLHQGLYHIYKVSDGTCFNMYYYQDRWVISTAKGYDMNTVSWDANGPTYQELITECLSKYNLTWDTFTSVLNKQRCYSFGFKHPNFHRFYEKEGLPIYRVWFIQSVDLDPQSNQYLWSNDTSPIECIPPQEAYLSQVSNLKDLYKQCGDALDNYLNNGTVLYGFILRSVNFEITKFDSDLFIESSLMREIRKTWYENKMIDECHRFKWNKEHAIILNAYLSDNLYEIFSQLFPQYKAKFVECSELVKRVVIECIRQINSETVQDNLTNLQKTAMKLLTWFKNNVNFDIRFKTDEQKMRILTEFITHKNHLSDLMALM